MNRWKAAVIVGMYAVFGAGCASLNTVQKANTLGKGHTQFALEPSFEGVGGGGTLGAIPRVDVSGRYGISDRVDLGVRVGLVGVELGAKFQLTPVNSPGVILSLAPSVGGMGLGGSGAGAGSVFFNAPLLIGIPTGGGSQLVIGPKLSDWLLFGSAGDSGGSTNVLFVGSTVGFALQVGQTFTLMPEVGVLYPIVGTVNTSSTDTSSVTLGQGVAFQVTLGFLFGG